MVFDFNEISKDDVFTAGGKGANLGEMTAAGINVPHGFIIGADVYRSFLKENDINGIIVDKVLQGGNDVRQMLDAAGKIRSEIRKGVFSKEIQEMIEKKYRMLGHEVRVAVRSSATAEDMPDASFAGQQETYLNVCGIKELLNRVRDCYASLWGDRAVSYRHHQGYDRTAVAIAVVVQIMIESEKSGVIFTVNPVNGQEDEMLINASYGLGESVVSGKVTADSYVTDKNGSVLEVSVGSKDTQIVYAEKETVEVTVDESLRKERALNEQEIGRLIKAGLEIERHYGRPMDIEWAIKDNRVYILQARPVTTLTNRLVDKKEAEKYTKNLKPCKSVRRNMSFFLEKIPFAYRALDFDFLTAISGQKAKIFAEGGIVFNADPEMDEDGIQTLPSGKKGININIFHFLKTVSEMKDFARCKVICDEFMKRYREQMAEIKKADFKKMSLSECGEFLKYSYELTRKLAYDRFKYALFPTMVMFDKYDRIIKKADKKYSAFDFYWELDHKTALFNRDVLKMAEHIKKNSSLKEAVMGGEKFQSLYTGFDDFKWAADEFIENNGFKSDYNCYCLAARSFIEEPDRMIDIVRPFLSEDECVGTKEKDNSFQSVMAELKKVYGERKYRDIEKNVDCFRYFHVVREETQYMWECLFYFVRKCVTRINIVLLNSDQYDTGVANLFYRELTDAVCRGYLNEADKEKIERRNRKYPVARMVWEASKQLVFDTRGGVLKGVGASAGTAVGKVCIIHNPQQFYKMKKGDILVCRLTDPEWTPLFKLACAVVADTGAALSHAAIVAREFGIPAVLGVGVATVKFKDGDLIQVDGNKGIVRSLSYEHKE